LAASRNQHCLALIPGTRFGVYEVTAQIGEGGMGQVYRAHDTKLNRDVALKILPDAFASDLDRLARFTREAQTLASLNHPNIAHIHGLEDSGGVRALVMELVEGDETCRRRTSTVERSACRAAHVHARGPNVSIRGSGRDRPDARWQCRVCTLWYVPNGIRTRAVSRLNVVRRCHAKSRSERQ